MILAIDFMFFLSVKLHAKKRSYYLDPVIRWNNIILIHIRDIIIINGLC
jgi:hypothetical protein